ncbi:phage tail protein [Muribacter muris]|uniref:Phage tail protein n=1 Tax=Muribacter muris TaxID=67855 RepID=A0A4Y9JTY3_9PAST|nr:phage tail protein [Muribacter muris]MBF0786078.1 phage tail protein [Muribacter muris]TFV07965.1 phage tail protein [Muribacter muris]
MTLQHLPFCPQPGFTVENEPRRKVNQFGDGYQQRRADGLNPLLRKYSLTFNLNPQQAVILDRFFATHGAVTAFYFRERHQSSLIKVVCQKWTKTVGRTHIQFSCEFEEVL